ncbi:MAG: ATP-binding cassette domain-containing protein [Zestosphaera sp.]
MRVELLTVRGLRKYFKFRKGLLSKTQYVHAVDDVSFSLPKGVTLGVVGESGSGKTTLGLTVLRLLEPTSGEVIFGNTNVTQLPKNMLREFRKLTGIVFQDPYSSLNPRMRVREILERPLKIHKAGDGEERLNTVVRALEEVGLSAEHLTRYPHELSGGQQQRVAIARAIILRPQLVVLDEPTSSLDVSVQAQILNLLLELQSRHELAYIFITHDLLTAKHVSDAIMVMYLGKVLEYAETHDIFNHPRHPYTATLLSSIPLPNPRLRGRKRVEVVGEPPSPINPPKGCRFHPRCPYTTDKCRKEEPTLEDAGNKHLVACHRARELSFNDLLREVSDFLTVS